MRGKKWLSQGNEENVPSKNLKVLILTFLFLLALPVELSVVDQLQELGLLLEVHREVRRQDRRLYHPHHVFVIVR